MWWYVNIITCHGVNRLLHCSTCSRRSRPPWPSLLIAAPRLWRPLADAAAERACINIRLRAPLSAATSLFPADFSRLPCSWSEYSSSTSSLIWLSWRNRIWRTMPTSNSSTRWSRRADTSMNLHWRLVAKRAPSATDNNVHRVHYNNRCSLRYVQRQLKNRF